MITTVLSIFCDRQTQTEKEIERKREPDTDRRRQTETEKEIERKREPDTDRRRQTETETGDTVIKEPDTEAETDRTETK